MYISLISYFKPYWNIRFALLSPNGATYNRTFPLV